MQISSKDLDKLNELRVKAAEETERTTKLNRSFDLEYD